MYIPHKIAITTNSRVIIFFFTGSVNGDTFPNYISVTNDDFGVGASIAKVLRFSTENCSGGDEVVFA
jgi:hypothetical protein